MNGKNICLTFNSETKMRILDWLERVCILIITANRIEPEIYS